VTPVPVVIDTDGGIDDAVALWWALTDPRVELVGVLATWGNVDLDVAAAVCLRVLAAAGRGDIPVALGAAHPLGPTPIPGLAPLVHGEDGLGGYGDAWPVGDLAVTEEPATELLARLTAERPGDITVVTIGPLSTTAAALRGDPAIAGRVRDVIVMGGAVAQKGNALPAGEANIAHDPVAAAEVVAASWTTPPLLVGLDVTHAALLDRSHLDLAAEGRTTAARMLADPLRFYADFYDRSDQTRRGAFPCHDLLAVMAAVDPAVITDAPLLPLAVDTGGSAAWGATIADFRPWSEVLPDGFHPWRIGLGVDADRFRAETERLFGRR
jgi:purine nucleosidase